MADNKRMALLALAGALQGFQQGKQRQAEQRRDEQLFQMSAQEFEFKKREHEIEMKKLGLELEELQYVRDLRQAMGPADEEADRRLGERERKLTQQIEEDALTLQQARADIEHTKQQIETGKATAESARASAGLSRKQTELLGEEEPDLPGAIRLQEAVVDELRTRLETAKGETRDTLEQELLIEEETLRVMSQEGIAALGAGDIVEDVQAQLRAPAPTEPAQEPQPRTAPTPISRGGTITENIPGALGAIGRGISKGVKTAVPPQQFKEGLDILNRPTELFSLLKHLGSKFEQQRQRSRPIPGVSPFPTLGGF